MTPVGRVLTGQIYLDTAVELASHLSDGTGTGTRTKRPYTRIQTGTVRSPICITSRTLTEIPNRSDYSAQIYMLGLSANHPSNFSYQE